jgi:hypothetical protein
MSPEERRYFKQLDEMILNCSEEDLQKIQELDLQTQLSGTSFYEVFSNSLKSKQGFFLGLSLLEK